MRVYRRRGQWMGCLWGFPRGGEGAVTDAQTPERGRAFPVVPGSTYGDWESVYRENLLGIYQLVFRRVGNAPDAEDLAEEVLMRTLKTLRLPAHFFRLSSSRGNPARTVPRGT